MQNNCIIMYALYIANVEPVHYLPGCFGAGKVKKKEENLKSITLFEVKDKQCIIRFIIIALLKGKVSWFHYLTK